MSKSTLFQPFYAAANAAAVAAKVQNANKKAAPSKQQLPAPDAKMQRLWQLHEWAAKLLRSAGIPEVLIPYAEAMVMHESNATTSNLAKDYNYSGIKYAKQPGQLQGRPAPKNEGGGYYAKYASPSAWAKDYKRIISLNRSGQGRPIDATNGGMFLARLKANGYYGVTYEQYRKAINAWVDKINKAKRWYTGYHNTHGYPDKATAGDWNAADDRAAAHQEKLANESESITDNMKKHWKWWLGGTAAAVGLILVLKK